MALIPVILARVSCSLLSDPLALLFRALVFILMLAIPVLGGCRRGGGGEEAPPFLCPAREVLRTAGSPAPAPVEAITPSVLARGCPEEYRDGNPQPPDLNVRSCHTQLVECSEGESAKDCGKRALMAGDWERAVQAFDAAPDSCEAYYGRYLSRLFRLYAHYNNLFFSDILEKDYNKNHLTRDLNVLINPEASLYFKHYACLANESFNESDLSASSLIDRYLELVWEKGCELRGPPNVEEGWLPIRWIQGRCEAPLVDTVFVGRWDRVDAVLMYQWLFGSPAETKRFINFLSGSSTEPCDDVVCQPLILGGIGIARLPADSEWLLKFVRKSSQELFHPERSKWGVFYWEDRNHNGKADLSDAVLARLCNPVTGLPTLELKDATVGATWTYKKATVTNPAPRRIHIYCGGKGACVVFSGEVQRNEAEPLWLNRFVDPSPDETQVAFLMETRPGIWHLYIASHALDEKGNFACPSSNYNDCCITCKYLPEGIKLAGALAGAPGVEPRWIPDPSQPSGPALGIVFMHNEHPSSWGWGGQGMGGQFIAVRPDGSGFSRLLPENIPFALHYQYHVSPDGRKLLWTSTWNPETGGAGPHHLLMGSIVYDPTKNEFRLENIHSVLPGRDHGWYEAHAFAPDYPEDRRIFFTSSAHSMQSPRGFMAVLDEKDRAYEFFKLSWPEEANPEPFKVDNHPAWNEHFFPVDHGKQVIFISTDGSRSAAERYDWYLNFPPYFEGVLFGLTLYTIRFAGFGNTGYFFSSLSPLPSWISNVDGSNREILFGSAQEAGWRTTGKLIHKGRIYFVQRNLSTGETRYGFMDFP